MHYKELPVSIYQKRFWFEWARNPDSSAYNVSAVYKFQGALRKDVLKQACHLLITKHEIFRSQFSDDGNHNCCASFNIDDFYFESVLDSALSVESQIISLLNLPFSLTGLPLLRFHLLLGKNTYYFLINVQHTILDGRSLAIISREISKIYNALISGKVLFSDNRPSLSEYINAEAELISKKNPEAAKKFWRKFLKGMPLSVALPGNTNFVSNARGSEAIFFEINGSLIDRLNYLASLNNTTRFVILLALYGLHLAKFLNQMQVLISYPKDMRPKKYKNVLGCFINNLPAKVILNDECVCLSDLIKTISLQRQQSSPFSWYPLMSIIRDQRESRGDLGRDCFSVGFSQANLNMAPVFLHGVEVHNMKLPWSHQAIYQLGMQYDDSLEDTILFKFEYQKNKFDSFMAGSFVSSFKKLLQKASIGDFILEDYLPLAGKEYQKLIYTWNCLSNFPVNKTLSQRFEDQVKLSPDTLALVFEGMSLSYRELNQKANQLARAIREQYQPVHNDDKLSPKNLIALYFDRGIELVVAILAVLKSGAAYVPIAVEYPIDRVQYILDDAKVSLILTQAEHEPVFKDYLQDGKARLLLTGEGNYDEYESTDLPVYSQPSDLAYVIYTSGTTGQPKGVLQTHANVARLFLSTAEEFNFTASDVWTLYHSYAFDFSVWEIWGALLHGGKLLIPSLNQVRDIPGFYTFCVTQGVTILNQTPTAFYQFIEAATQDERNGLSRLRYIILGGEALKLSQIRKWWQYVKRYQLNVELINMYGITETTVHVTLKRLSAEDDGSVSNIGRPLKDLCVYVLNSQLQPVPLGVVGELYVGGEGLAVGYLNQPELTRERFIKNPFLKVEGGMDARLYKTGDLVKYLPDGDLVYVGRNDNQVKIRGYRIELKEIENILSGFDELGHCCIVDKELGGSKILVCYYTGRINDMLLKHIKKQARLFLPEYMLPSHWSQLDELPKTDHDKIDIDTLKNLPILDRKNKKQVNMSKLERAISLAWQKVLQGSKIELDDNFFDIGGSSIKALSLHAILQTELSLDDISVVDLFEYPTIRKYAKFICTQYPNLAGSFDRD